VNGALNIINKQLVDSTGKKVTLVGINYGDIPENFKSGNYATDAQNIKNAGFNAVKLVKEWGSLENSANSSSFTYNSVGMNKMMQQITELTKRGIYVVVKLHADKDTSISGNTTNLTQFLGAQYCPTGLYDSKFTEGFYTSSASQSNTSGDAHLVKLWLEISKRTRNNPLVIGFDILNEPTYCSGSPTTIQTAWHQRIKEIAQALRNDGDNRIIFAEEAPMFYHPYKTFQSYSDPKIISSIHWYKAEYKTTATSGTWKACWSDINIFRLYWNAGPIPTGTSCSSQEPTWLQQAQNNNPNQLFEVGEFGDIYRNAAGGTDQAWNLNMISLFKEKSMIGWFYWSSEETGTWINDLISTKPISALINEINDNLAVNEPESGFTILKKEENSWLANALAKLGDQITDWKQRLIGSASNYLSQSLGVNADTNYLNYSDSVSWTNVAGWGEQYGPLSYLVKILNTNSTDVTNLATGFFGACSFQSNSQNTWQAQACCTADGQDCGPASTWTFNTTLPPELVYPPDPDHEGPQEAVTNDFPLKFEWCQVPGAVSYFIDFRKKDFTSILSDWPVDKLLSGILPSEFTETLGVLTKNTAYDWEVATCLKPGGTQCGLSCGPTQNGMDCRDSSQKWQTISMTNLEAPTLRAPANGTVVNAKNYLEWTEVRGAYSYVYQLLIGNSSNPIPTNIVAYFGVTKVPMSGIFLPNTSYKWKVKSCWDENGKNCENNWSAQWQFQTTGATPTTTDPMNNEKNVLIPVKLNWADMPGAVSYRYQISTNKDFSIVQSPLYERLVQNSEDFVDSPNIKSNTAYWWRVQTCADDIGTYSFCGNWAQRNFTTIALSAPANISPLNNGEISAPAPLQWGSVLGAKFYQYKVDYIIKAPEEKSALCQPGTAIPPIIVPANSLTSGLNCVGQYQWQVRACVDKNCDDAGPLSQLWNFTLKVPSGSQGGLIPCGRYVDDPKTSYDEREACETKHLFLLIKIILDFLLWRLVPIIIVLLVAAIGLMYYLSFGMAEMISKAREALKAAIIGYAILLLAWFIINWILIMFGVTINWWIFSF